VGKFPLKLLQAEVVSIIHHANESIFWLISKSLNPIAPYSLLFLSFIVASKFNNLLKSVKNTSSNPYLLDILMLIVTHFQS
jgi:hypothetical protein